MFNPSRGEIRLDSTAWAVIGVIFFALLATVYFSWLGSQLGSSLLGADRTVKTAQTQLDGLCAQVDKACKEDDTLCNAHVFYCSN